MTWPHRTSFERVNHIFRTVECYPFQHGKVEEFEIDAPRLDIEGPTPRNLLVPHCAEDSHASSQGGVRNGDGKNMQGCHTIGVVLIVTIAQ